MKIPQHIFIGDTREDTEHAFEHLLEKREEARILILTSSLSSKHINWLRELLNSLTAVVELIHIGRGDMGAVKHAVENIKKYRATICIGAGGGRVIDVAKFASFQGNILFVSYPTLLSHDGIASPVAVIPDGEHWSESRMAASPFSVIVDLETVAGAPPRSTLSGISDLTANLFAALDAERFGAGSTGEYGTLATAIGRSASQLVFPGFGKLTVHALTTEQLKPLAWGLVLSGIAMAITGDSRPASGAEHKISHAIDYLFGVPVSHGFTVSVGNVVSAFLHGRYEKEIVGFNTALGLPVVSEDIGIEKKDFAEVLRYARTIRPERHTILEEKKLTGQQITELLERIEEAKERAVKG